MDCTIRQPIGRLVHMPVEDEGGARHDVHLASGVAGGQWRVACTAGARHARCQCTSAAPSGLIHMSRTRKRYCPTLQQLARPLKASWECKGSRLDGNAQYVAQMLRCDSKHPCDTTPSRHTPDTTTGKHSTHSTHSTHTCDHDQLVLRLPQHAQRWLRVILQWAAEHSKACNARDGKGSTAK
jgi:hypothetical protein